MSYCYLGVTCDGYGVQRGRRLHRVVCAEDGEHLPGTCHLVRGSLTVSVEQDPDCAGLPKCKVCHRESARAMARAGEESR